MIEVAEAPSAGNRRATTPSVAAAINKKNSVNEGSERLAAPASEVKPEGLVPTPPKSVPHRIAASVVIKSGRQLNPLETALIEALKSRDIKVDDPVEPVDILIDIARQENPPTGAATLVGAIEFHQALGENCRFSVVHSEPRFSPSQPVFTPASLAPAIDEVLTKLRAFAAKEYEQCESR
jgi:hypothetical protein